MTRCPSRPRLPRNAGIAIGPILFVIALLAVLAAVASSGSGGFSTATITDRVAADTAAQANLIRAKILECNSMRGTDNNYDGYPSSDASAGTLVSALNCEGDPTGMKSLWSGSRVTMLPPPTSGFGPWHYINTNGSGLGGTATGGRCIWIQPSVSNPLNDKGIVEGLSKAASKFTSATSYTNTAEAIYDPSSTSQKFVLWITMPTGTPNANCTP